MAELELLTRERAEEAKALPLPGRHAFPSQAWHASAQVRHAYLSGKPAKALPSDLRTGLDAGLQSALEAFFQEQADAADSSVQYSAIVIDIATREVRAHIGSSGRKRPGGWIDLTRSARSPGSTLKPFIYGLAFDDGQALPGTFIEDLPARFNSYRPENFDRTFRGQVRVQDALQHSLNVPAVLALERIGPERFASALTLSGIRVQIHSGADRDAGLALALGGAGMTVQDLASLYAALGDNGIVRPLSWLPADAAVTTDRGHRFMSEASADRIIDILKSAPAPSGRMPARLTQDAPEIAFKTGTSYGFRDAWAAGVARGYAVVVWAGRADGAPRPGETGRKTALPLLYSVFDLVGSRLGAEGRASDRLMTAKKDAPHFAMVDFAGEDQPPMILFPPDNAVLLQKRPDHPNPGFVLSGRGKGALSWFVNGRVIEQDAAGAPVWVPAGAGFYSLSAVDETGRETRVLVRVSDFTNG
jgi:penicillin-binding protein 1C